MSVLTKTGTFSVSATGSKAITGVGFQPKLVIVWFGASPGSLYHSLGMATSSSQEWAVSAFSADGFGTSETHSAGRADVTINLKDGGATYTLADFTSMDADGFTLNVQTAVGTQTLFYFALGGTDVTNVQVGSTLVPPSGSTHAVTGVGFTADLYLFSYSGQQDWNAAGVNAIFGMGAMTAAAQAAAYGWTDHGGGTTTNSWERDDAVMLLAFGEPPTPFLRVSKSAIGSDGFTLNLDDPGSSNAELGYAAIKFTSSSWVKLGKETQPTSAQTKATSGLGLTPAGALFFGCMMPASSSPQNEANFCIGAWDGTNHRSFAICDADAVSPTNADRRASTTKAIQKINGSGTMVSEAGVSASAYDSLTLDWTTADATAREFFYVALGDPASPSTFKPQVISF